MSKPGSGLKDIDCKTTLAQLSICSSQSTALWEKPLHGKPNGLKKTRLQIRADSAVTFATQLCAYIIYYILYIYRSMFVISSLDLSLPFIYMYKISLSLSLSLNLSLLFLISAIFIYIFFFALSLRPLALGSFDPREAL